MSSSEHDLVSVILPVHNGERYVRAALDSALAQTHQNLEILAMDDCSTDTCPVILQEAARSDARVRVFRNERNLGVAGTRNRAFQLARGVFVALLDDDDLWLPDKLERQLAALDASGSDLCCTSYALIDAQGESTGRVYTAPERITFDSQLYENGIGASTVLLRREWVERFSMHGEYAHEDYVFWLELLRAGCTVCPLREPLTLYRALPGSRSGNKARAAANRWRVYRSFLGFGPLRSARCFLSYAARGVRKHFLRQS